MDDRPIRESIYGNCVFMKHYDSALCLPGIEFDDAPVLNKSGIIKGASCEGALRSLLYKSPDDALYSFYSTSALFSVITDILTSEQRSKKADSRVEEILEYIRKNPEGDLSGDALSKLFSYHKNHINKLIKRETGRSLTGYVRYIKVEHAKSLLSEELCSTSEVAMRLGYYDYSHFYKAFFLETGARPTDHPLIKSKSDG
jgi:AraC-like DNA-binding protein